MCSYSRPTFIFDSAEQGGRRFALEEDGYIYTRLGNPTNSQVEDKLASMENAEAAVSMGSGIGVITSVIWSAVKGGDHIVAAKTLYGFLNHGISEFGVEVSFVDTSDPENVKKALKPNTKLVYLESPANPNMAISDIIEISKIAHEVEGCIVVVDNTYCSPYIQRPLDLGADVVVHSATKYLNGHGGVIAEFLENHPAVESVSYPGLRSFPQYELAKKQMFLPGAMIVFEIKGGIDAGRILLIGS